MEPVEKPEPLPEQTDNGWHEGDPETVLDQTPVFDQAGDE